MLSLRGQERGQEGREPVSLELQTAGTTPAHPSPPVRSFPVTKALLGTVSGLTLSPQAPSLNRNLSVTPLAVITQPCSRSENAGERGPGHRPARGSARCGAGDLKKDFIFHP